MAGWHAAALAVGIGFGAALAVGIGGSGCPAVCVSCSTLAYAWAFAGGQGGRSRGVAAEAGVAGGLRFNTIVPCARGGLADVFAAVRTPRQAEAFSAGGVGTPFV